MDDDRRSVVVTALSMYATSLAENRTRLESEKGKGKSKATAEDLDVIAEVERDLVLCHELAGTLGQAPYAENTPRSFYRAHERPHGHCNHRRDWLTDSLEDLALPTIIDDAEYINPFTGLPVIRDTGYEPGPSNRPPPPPREKSKPSASPITLRWERIASLIAGNEEPSAVDGPTLRKPWPPARASLPGDVAEPGDPQASEVQLPPMAPDFLEFEQKSQPILPPVPSESQLDEIFGPSESEPVLDKPDLQIHEISDTESVAPGKFEPILDEADVQLHKLPSTSNGQIIAPAILQAAKSTETVAPARKIQFVPVPNGNITNEPIAMLEKSPLQNPKGKMKSMIPDIIRRISPKANASQSQEGGERLKKTNRITGLNTRGSGKSANTAAQSTAPRIFQAPKAGNGSSANDTSKSGSDSSNRKPRPKFSNFFTRASPGYSSSPSVGQSPSAGSLSRALASPAKALSRTKFRSQKLEPVYPNPQPGLLFNLPARLPPPKPQAAPYVAPNMPNLSGKAPEFMPPRAAPVVPLITKIPYKDTVDADAALARALSHEEAGDLQLHLDQLLINGHSNDEDAEYEDDYAFSMPPQPKRPAASPSTNPFRLVVDEEGLDMTSPQPPGTGLTREEQIERSLAEAHRLQEQYDLELRNAREAEASWEVYKAKNITTCVVCGDDQHRDDQVRPCEHDFCIDCLTEGFRNAVKTKSPFRCCKKSLRADEFGHVLPPDVVAAYKALLLELTTTHRVYCHAPTCSKFIPPQDIVGDAAPCSACGLKTCRHCRKALHEGSICAEDAETKVVSALGLKKGWKVCPGCSNLIERDSGCLHMVCTWCKTAFCYRCSKRWDDCESTCPDALSATHPKNPRATKVA